MKYELFLKMKLCNNLKIYYILLLYFTFLDFIKKLFMKFIVFE